MACAKTPITDASDCGYLCLCVCKCERGGVEQPQCPHWHIYNLHLELTGCTVTEAGGDDPADSLRYVLMSMHEVTEDYFIWKRPRLPSDATVGNVTIKTAKTLSEVASGCTGVDDVNQSGALDVKYISVTTDSGLLVYEWDEGTEQLCKTSGPVGCRIDSIESNWSLLPAGGADLCCMPRKVVRRIWDRDFADADSYTPTVDLRDMTDGTFVITCPAGADEETVKSGSCSCHNTWARTWGDGAFDTSSFGGLIDGFYLTASFSMQEILLPPISTGPCGEINTFPVPPCVGGCDAISNMLLGPVTMVFGPSTECFTSTPRMLFNRDCADCLCTPLTGENKIQAPVNYTHLTNCCERGGGDVQMCPDTGEAFNDQNCTTIFAYLTCGCVAIPETATPCTDDNFLFPTCPIIQEEWNTPQREYIQVNEGVGCACLGGTLTFFE